MPVKIGLTGVSGNLGKHLKNLISESNNLECIGGISTKNSTSAELTKLCQMADVIIDFSSSELIDALLEHAIKSNTPLVIGTTGYSNRQLDLIQISSKKIPIFYSSNFSLGIHVLKKMLKTLSNDLKEYQINLLEWHISNKKDFPSGTAKDLIREIKSCGDQSIEVTSIRSGNAFCEHVIYFTNDAERVAIKHEICDKKTFAIQALKAALFILSQSPGYYEMNDLIENPVCMQ